MILPSKELLSKVLDTIVLDIKISEDLLLYTSYEKPNIGNWRAINIYKLQHKMKEWAYSKGFKILDECNAIIITTLTDREVHIEDEDFKIPYKLDRVFKACEWVYKEINKWTETK